MTQNNLPKEIEQLIKDEAEKRFPKKPPHGMTEYRNWELVRGIFIEAATFMHTHLSESHEKEIAELKALLYEVCIRANVIFPATEDGLKWFDEKFKNKHELMLKIDNQLK